MTNFELEQTAYETLAQTPEAHRVLGWKPLPAPPVAPPFPMNTLPGPLADMTRAVAENQSAPVELPAVTGLAVLAACACGRVTVHIRRG